MLVARQLNLLFQSNQFLVDFKEINRFFFFWQVDISGNVQIEIILFDLIKWYRSGIPAYLAAILICLDNVNPEGSLGSTQIETTPSKSVIAAIGSERGWTDRERELLEATGYVRCDMGERIMRTETAATVAGAIILSGLGII